MTADRGYGEARVEANLHALVVRTVVISRKGQPGPTRRQVEQRQSFRTLVKWRTGCEGLSPTSSADPAGIAPILDGTAGASTWCGHGVFAHNLIKIIGLVA